MAGKDSKYVFDRGSFSFKEAPRRIWKVLWNIVLLLLVSASGTILMYFAVSLFASTKTERQLRREIRMYEKNYALLEPKADLLATACAFTGAAVARSMAENVPEDVIRQYGG